MLGEPTLAEVKAWLKLTDDIDDVPLQAGLEAAIDHQRTHLRFPVTAGGDGYYTDDLRLAVFLRTARYLARRNSPEGLVGFADFGLAQVALSDRDVAQLESPYQIQVVA